MKKSYCSPNSLKEGYHMPGIPNNLHNLLRKVLLECGPFETDQQIRAVFTNSLLAPWRNRLPQANNPADRVDSIISFLVDKRRAETQTSALVLLLGVLRDRTDQDDECYPRLSSLAEAVDAAMKGRTHEGFDSSAYKQEANPANQQMIFTADWMKLLENVRSVGQLNVPKFLRGQLTQQIPSGTGWLVGPRLALTCWHVMKARGQFDGAIGDADLKAQVENSVLTFDYTLPGQGVEYQVAVLECFDADLDYAVLRLQDRPDYPLDARGTIKLDVNMPLTAQSTLYVIQHPKGLPQQNSSGRFFKYKVDQPSRILHSAPTEPGTSGAPVLNVTNWSAVALHDGENNDEQLREATLLSALLPDIQRKCLEVYNEIMYTT